MEIVQRDQIPLQKPKRPLLEWVALDGLIVHYVGSANLWPTAANPRLPTDAESRALVRSIQAHAFTSPEHYIDIQYNFLVDAVGRVYEGRGFRYQSGANGSTNYNRHAGAIAWLGGPDTLLTDDAKTALLWLTQEWARKVPQLSYVKGHRDVFGTACPGNALEQHVPHLAAHMHDATGQPHPPSQYPVHEYGENEVQSTLVNITTDGDGNGVSGFGSGLTDVVGVVLNGPYPWTDGYWYRDELPQLSAQIHNGQAFVSVVHGKPSHGYTVRLTVR